LSRHHLKVLLEPQGILFYEKEYLLGLFILSMAEEVSFKICGFDVKLYRDSKNPFNIIFEISKKGWNSEMIFKFFEKHIGKFQEYARDYLKLDMLKEWILIHRFLLLLSSYFRDRVELEDWIWIEPQDIEMIFVKPKNTERANIVTGRIRFTLEAQEVFNRYISLEEAKEIFMGLFKYMIMKEGFEVLTKLSMK